MTPPRNPWALMALELRDVAEEALGALRPYEVAALTRIASDMGQCSEAEAVAHAVIPPRLSLLDGLYVDTLGVAADFRRLMDVAPEDEDFVAGYRAAVALVVGLRARLDAESRKGLDS